MNDSHETLVEGAELPGDDLTEAGEHIRVVRYECPRCSARAVIRISAGLAKASFRCKRCGYVIVV